MINNIVIYASPILNDPLSTSVVIDVDLLKNNLKDSVNKGDVIKTKEYLNQISEKCVGQPNIDPVVASHIKLYSDELNRIETLFIKEYLPGIEESKQPQLIIDVMKVTEGRLQNLVEMTLKKVEQEKLKNRCRDRVLLGVAIGGSCLVFSSFSAIAITMMLYT